MNSQGAEHVISWELASTAEYRQLLSKFKQIEQYMEPPFVVETIAKRFFEGAGKPMPKQRTRTGLKSMPSKRMRSHRRKRHASPSQ